VIGFTSEMPWKAQLFTVTLLVLAAVWSFELAGRGVNATANTKPADVTVYWNMTNQILLSSKDAHVINIRMQEKLDIICPKYNPDSPTSQWEYYIVYKVSEDDFNNCIINTSSSNTRLVVNCSHPTDVEPVSFTLLVWPYQAIPGPVDFMEGHTYYFISTTTSTLHGLGNQWHGMCRTKNMKMILNVLKQDATIPTRQPGTRPTTQHNSSCRTQTSLLVSAVCGVLLQLTLHMLLSK
jgi:hypothetical protein